MKSIIAVLAILVFAVPTLAATTTEPKPIPIAGGEFIQNGDSMIVSLQIPLAKNRDTLYGNYVQAPGGQKVNLDTKKDVLEWADALRDQLLQVQTPLGLFAARSVIVSYNQLIITRYPNVDWALLEKPLEIALKEATKGKIPAAKK